MKKLLLVNPLPGGKRNKSGGAAIFKIIPLQLLTIAAMTPSDWQVEIQDEAVEALSFEQSPDLVGISIKACTAPRGYQIARQFRDRGIPVVMGGSHASLSPESVSSHVDSVVIGGVESNWPKILEDFVQSKLRPRYFDHGYGSIVQPQLPWSLVRNKGYKISSVCSTRGCWHRCSFCTIPKLYNYTVRQRPVQDVIADISNIDSRFFILWDENLGADSSYSTQLFEAMIPLKKYWAGETTALISRDKRLLKLMRKSGCLGLFLGLESVSQLSLDHVRKGFNKVSDYADIVTRLADHGIAAHAGIVLGFDYDDESIFDRTLECLYRCNFNSASFKILTPYPGTVLHAELSQQGRIFDHDLEHYDELHAVFQPKKLTAQQLHDGLVALSREYYSVGSIGKRTLANLSMDRFHLPLYLVTNFGYRKAYYHDLGL